MFVSPSHLLSIVSFIGSHTANRGIASLQVRHRPLTREKGAPERLIQELAEKGYVRQEDKPELRRIWLTRNKVIHPPGEP